jgi:hypothetical protein
MSVRHRWMQCWVAAVLHIGAGAATAQQTVPAELRIDVRDLAGVPADIMRDTRAEVAGTLRAAGVRIAWVEGAHSPASAPSLTLFVVGGSTTAPHGTAPGVAVVGLAPESGTWMQVFYRRVAAAVATRSVPLSVVLAHVIAHELGHLLLPLESHAAFGVMRHAVDLTHPSLRRFSADESRLIRAAVATGRRYASRCDHQ